MNTIDEKNKNQTDASASINETAVVPFVEKTNDDAALVQSIINKVPLCNAAVQREDEGDGNIDEDMLLLSQEEQDPERVTLGTDTGTLDSDQQSNCSDRSGATLIGECLNKLEVRTGQPFVKLTSAEKRRFKRALADGLTREQALEKAKSPPERKEPSKRALSDDKPTPSGKRPRANDNPQTSSKPTYSHVLGTVKLGFVTNDVSINPLNDEQMSKLQEAIIDTTIEHGEGFRPEFEGCFPRTGWLMVACTNRKTADWLKAHANSVKEKSKLDVNIVDEADFPRSHFVRGYFPHSLDLANEKILASIAVQNDLNARNWKVVMRKSDGQLLHLLMAVDDNSWARLLESNGRIAYRFSHLKLMLKDTNKESAVDKQSVTKVFPTATEGKKEELKVLMDVNPSSSKAVMEKATVKAASPTKGTASNFKVPPNKGRPDRSYEMREKGPRRARLQKLVAISQKNSEEQ